jgi:SET domain-containing protein
LLTQSPPAYRLLQIPRTAPFELKPTPGKGWGVSATRRIVRGDPILAEKPLFVIRKPQTQMGEADVSAAVNKLAPAEKRQFLALRSGPDATQPFKTWGFAFAENTFAITSPGGWGANRGAGWAHGCYLLLSRFNHSCAPNAKVPTGGAGETLRCYATKDVAAGEEITISYSVDFEAMTSVERQEALKWRNVARCRCAVCTGPGRRMSDLRRRLIRGLRYLSFGKDMDGTQQAWIKPDPALRRAAERFDVPLPDRVVYAFFLGYLLGQEGLLEDELLDKVNAGIEVAGFMGTRENMEITMQAMAQRTWLKKLCVAFHLYGTRMLVIGSLRCSRGGQRGCESAAP